MRPTSLHIPSKSVVPVFFPIDDPKALTNYRGFINSYVQAAIKQRNDPLIREHLQMLAESILKALR